MTVGDLKSVGSGFIAGTLVHTDRGLVPIEQIKVGDLVLSKSEETGQQAYKRVVNAYDFEDKEIWVVKIRNWKPDDITKDSEAHHLYCTGNHPFWVKGIGWTATEQLRDGYGLRLADDSEASVIIVWPVIRTPSPGIGWVSADTLGNWDGLERAHIVDFRDGCNLWKYPIRRREQAGIPYAASLISRKIDEVFDGYEMCDIFEGNDRLFKTRVFNLEVEDYHTYYIGELGACTGS